MRVAACNPGIGGGFVQGLSSVQTSNAMPARTCGETDRSSPRRWPGSLPASADFLP